MLDRVAPVTQKSWIVLLPQCPVATSSQLAEIETAIVKIKCPMMLPLEEIRFGRGDPICAHG